MNVFGEYLDRRRDQASDDAKQKARDGMSTAQTPDAVIERLLVKAGGLFYKEKGAREWLQERQSVMLALTWPAAWAQQRGISIPLVRYEAILVEIMDGIRKHGDLAKIKFFPAYLANCIRLYYVHQGEHLYYELKHVRNALDLAVIRGKSRPATNPDPMAALAAAHSVLLKSRPGRKTQKTDDSQGTLF